MRSVLAGGKARSARKNMKIKLNRRLRPVLAFQGRARKVRRFRRWKREDQSYFVEKREKNIAYLQKTGNISWPEPAL